MTRKIRQVELDGLRLIGLGRVPRCRRCPRYADLVEHYVDPRTAATGLAAVPPLWNQLKDLEWPTEAMQSLRYITNTGGAMPVSTTRALQQALPNALIFLMYGLTESFRSSYLPPEQVEGFARKRTFPLIAPLLGVFLRFRQRRARSLPLPADAGSGPFGYIVSALGDLPAARYLYDLIDKAWQSPILPRRTKALIFAVIARALDCPLPEREAIRLLSEEGLASEDVLQILSHLASAKLDTTEAVIVPFARDTVWYRPAQIQQQGRALRERLTQAQFLEVVGVSAAANAICRLSVLVKHEP